MKVINRGKGGKYANKEKGNRGGRECLRKERNG